MADPITWRSVGTPNLGDPSRTLLFAQQAFKDAVGGVQGMLNQRATVEDQNWEAAKKANTNAFLNRLSEFKTAEEAQAAMPELNALRTSFGAQIDGAATRAAQDSLAENLQRRYTQNQAYIDTKAGVEERPIVAALHNALQAAGTTNEATNLQGAVRAYADSGHITPQTAIKLMDATLARGTTISDQSWKEKDRTQAEKKWEREAEKHPLEMQNIRSQIHARNLEAEARLKSASNDNVRAITALATARGAELSAAEKLAEEQRKGREALLNDNPFARRIGNYKDKTPLGTSLDKEHKLAAGDGAAIVAELTKNPIKINGKTIDVPIHVLEAAVSDVTRDWIPNWAGGGIASRVRSATEKLMKDEGTLLGYQNADVLKANILKAPQDAQPGANTALLRTEALGKPPSVSKSGLEFSDPKRLNITSSEGVMVPASIPKGKQSVQVTDGDTITVTGENGAKLSFRLNGVDAQETVKQGGKAGQKHSEGARQFLQDALTKGQVEFQISSNKPDAYGRHVAEVFVDGQNLNDILLSKGMASTMSIGEGPAAKRRRELLQIDAIKKQQGMHQDMGSNDGLPGSIYRSLGNIY